jgi:hypothetical protein
VEVDRRKVGSRSDDVVDDGEGVRRGLGISRDAELVRARRGSIHPGTLNGGAGAPVNVAGYDRMTTSVGADVALFVSPNISPVTAPDDPPGLYASLLLNEKKKLSACADEGSHIDAALSTPKRANHLDIAFIHPSRDQNG